MARWLQGAPADVRRAERNFTPDPLPDALVFHNRPLPAGAVTPEKLTENWIVAAKAQLSAANQQTVRRALLHALEYADDTAKPAEKTRARGPRTVLLASPDAELEALLKRDRLAVSAVTFTPFDAEAAAKIRLFDSYNRTAASQRVADIVAAARAHPGAVLVAQGDAALSGLPGCGCTNRPRRPRRGRVRSDERCRLRAEALHSRIATRGRFADGCRDGRRQTRRAQRRRTIHAAWREGRSNEADGSRDCRPDQESSAVAKRFFTTHVGLSRTTGGSRLPRSTGERENGRQQISPFLSSPVDLVHLSTDALLCCEVNDQSGLEGTINN